MNNTNRIPTFLRITALFWAYFIGIGALGGSLMMFLEPHGMFMHMEIMLPLLSQKLPWFASLFHNFIASGIVLLLVCGITNFVSIFLWHRHHRYAPWSSLACGIILILFMCLEFYVWGFVFASVLYFVFGLLQSTTALCILRGKQE